MAIQLTPEAFRAQFPRFAQSSDAELTGPLAEAAQVYQAGDVSLLGYLAAHFLQLRILEESGEMPEPGFSSTSYGRHYLWRIKRDAEPTVSC